MISASQDHWISTSQDHWISAIHDQYCLDRYVTLSVTLDAALIFDDYVNHVAKA